MFPRSKHLSKVCYFTQARNNSVKEPRLFIGSLVKLLMNTIQIIQTPCTDSTHAMTFAAVTGAGGVLLLYTLVNPLTAELGALNLFLYT